MADRDLAHDLHSVAFPTLGGDDLDERRIADVRAAFDELGAVAAVEQRIEALTASGLAALATAPVAEPAATRLAELAVSVTRRVR